MKDGFIKTAAAVPPLKVSDCSYNSEQIIRLIKQARSESVSLLVFPELCVTGYSCSDLFLQDRLLSAAETAVRRIADSTAGCDMLVFIGAPVSFMGKLYNCAVALHSGRILGVVPKTFLPSYNEFYEQRQFTKAFEGVKTLNYAGSECCFGTDILFCCKEVRELIVACEICEDLWIPQAPSVRHCASGASVIANLSASTESIGKPEYRRELVSVHSSTNLCGYIYCGAGSDESTTDLVYSGHSLIYESGRLLAEKKPFSDSELLVTEIDVKRVAFERRRMSDFVSSADDGHRSVLFSLPVTETKLTRSFEKRPFVPSDEHDKNSRCSFIVEMQAAALAKRMKHTGAKTAVVGISGGLDSTLALLVTVKAFEKLGLPSSGIMTVTMPCFGTGKRTRENAQTLCNCLDTEFVEVDIKEAVRLHLADIGHDETTYDVTYENAQARERTQVLMDLANKYSGIVIGTGDLSEAALGWSTYNGDHMSMYAVNCSVPKTLVRYIVKFFADTASLRTDEKGQRLSKTLYDIIDTPVSPELIPSDDGYEPGQKTEKILGSYEIHDFFLYYFVRCGFSYDKILRVALKAFEGSFGCDEIKDTLDTFFRRFFSQQFKRSCVPDGVKVGSVSLSPRGDWRMPSDASVSDWLQSVNRF